MPARLPKICSSILAATIGFAIPLAAQVDSGFDSVTIKRSAASGHYHLDFDGRTFRASNFPLRQVILFAYGLRFDDPLQSGPAWIDTEAYDIDAVAEHVPAAAGPDQPTDRARIQQLLRDKFQLAAHVEHRGTDVLALTIAKGGPRLAAAPVPAGGSSRIRIINQGLLQANGATMGELAEVLRSYTRGTPILDQTGLSGSYKFTLHWNALPAASIAQGVTVTRDFVPSKAAETFDEQCRIGQVAGGCFIESLVPSLNTALQAELGLSLQPAKTWINVLVIDHIERPTLR